MPPGLILDTSAVLAYTLGISDVGDRIARRADVGETVLVPVLCLAEAYGRVSSDEAGMLDVIRHIPNVRVTSVEPDMAPFLGGLTKKLGRVDVAQVVITASEHQVRVMTSERDLITQILPKEWPIIDL